MDDDDGDDAAAPYDKILQMLEAYAQDIIRGYDKAFAVLGEI
jgi:hypothetical protein